jgi:hypothetical protein
MEKRTPVWLWLNLLSLDAPLVALVWQDFLARSYPAMLRPAGRIALGLTVWAIYLTDRLLDVRHPVSEAETMRHSFYRRHSRLALGALVSILVADVVIIFSKVRPAVLEHGVFIGAGILAYLAAFPLGRKGGIGWKKVIAGVLFTAGVFLVAATGTTHAGTILIWPAAAFCALCVGNLLLVESWERREKAHGWVWMAALCLLCLWAGDSPWFRAVAISAAGLGALALSGDRISADGRGVLADAILLTPLLFR